MKFRVLLGVISFVFVVSAKAENQNNKNAPPPRAAPVVRPVVRPQMVRPTQGAPGQQMQGRPGQVMQGQRPLGQAQLVRPGVVRGPAGALRIAMPTNIVHNARHVAGKAAGRYNKQAFMFKRGKHFYRRAYYIGPDGGIYFYDEPVPDDDPTMAAMLPSSLPTCPIDADDCQGFSDPVAQRPVLSPRASALEFILSFQPSCQWQENGIVFTIEDTGEPNLVSFGEFKVKIVNSTTGGNILQAEVGSWIARDVCTIAVGSYEQNKETWDRAIRSLRILGMQVPAAGWGERDITSIQ